MNRTEHKIASKIKQIMPDSDKDEDVKELNDLFNDMHLFLDRFHEELSDNIIAVSSSLEFLETRW